MKSNEKLKNIFSYIKSPDKWVYFLIFISTIILSILSIFISIRQGTLIIDYIIYALAALDLAYAVYLFIRICPKIKSIVTNVINKNRFTRKMMENYGYRTSINAVFSAMLNTIYCGILIVTAIISESIWIITLSSYYFVLTITKLVVLFGGLRVLKNKNANYRQKEIKTYRNCGIFLIIMSIAMTGMLVQMINMEADIHYPELFIYVIAAYTTYRVTIAIISIFKAKKTNNFIIQAIKNIDLTSAAVSLFSMQVAMINAFSNGEGLFHLNLIVGISISILIIGIGIFMIYKGKRELNKQDNKNE